MNKEVNFEIAKLLKEKGFDDDNCEQVYLGDFDEEFPPEKIEISERMLRERTIGEWDYLAPKIHQVVMWLYENHGIWIGVNLNFRYQIETKKHGVLHTKNEFKSPTAAYEAAIEYTLNNLI